MASSIVDEALLKNLADFLKKEDLGEIEIESDGVRIRLARSSAAMVMAPLAPPAAASAAGQAGASQSESSQDDAVHPGVVKSPIVGTVYLAPESGAKAFVQIGDTVSEDQTLMIIEAMKTMNPIQAPQAGTVKEILVGNGQPVEYGEPLIVIE